MPTSSRPKKADLHRPARIYFVVQIAHLDGRVQKLSIELPGVVRGCDVRKALMSITKLVFRACHICPSIYTGCLLTECFRLMMRVENKTMSACALTASGGPKLQKSAIAEKDCTFDLNAR